MNLVKLRDLMTGTSKVRYLLWRALRLPSDITIQLTSGERLSLRPFPSDDIATAFEIFAAQVYESPIPIATDSVSLIVDLGANVGFSGIFFAYRYPGAKIIAFEPHPEHIKIAGLNLQLNNFSQNVDLINAAASTQTKDAFLTNKGVCSTVVSQEVYGAIPIKLINIFDYLKDMEIDILKIDIEGGEFDLINDHRFEKIKAKIIVLEYHINPDFKDACKWCQQKLAEFGYKTELGAWNSSKNGFIWAYKQKYQQAITNLID
jgi:FkbM family methyltransferase